MRRTTVFGAAFNALLAIAPVPANAAVDDAREAAPQTLRLPGTGFDIALGGAAVEPQAARIDPALLLAIVVWLSDGYDLPASAYPPGVAFVPAKMMAALRYASVAMPVRSTSQATAGSGRRGAADFAALYDDEDKVIYLPLGWTGSTPAELSMLVHEMVHHLQNMAGLTFACPEAREKPAYRAQQDWLALFGRDFFEDFETDPFSLLVRTECAF